MDLHSKPFDEGTVAKLEIFEDYAKAWLPTFVMQQRPVICVFDFFAGTGYDKNGIPGSPIRLLNQIHQQLASIRSNSVKVHLYLNEFQPDRVKQEKFHQLKASCEKFIQEYPGLKNVVEVHYSNENCETLLPKHLPLISKHVSLVYLDQNGVKFLTSEYLQQFEKMRETDFLYFVSSSYTWRFGKTPEFEQYLRFDVEELKKNPYTSIHRSIIEQLRGRLQQRTSLKLYPFTIKKGKNVYGIIFGASHPRAVDKFLNIAWKRNGVNGEANFDIDGDRLKAQTDLFGNRTLTKKEKFAETLAAKVLAGELKTNKDVLDYTYEQGHIASHAADVLKSLKSAGKLTYESSFPLVTYENVYKTQRIISYSLTKQTISTVHG